MAEPATISSDMHLDELRNRSPRSSGPKRTAPPKRNPGGALRPGATAPQPAPAIQPAAAPAEIGFRASGGAKRMAMRRT